MHTQNTRVHPRLWHRHLWQLTLAELALTASVYGMVPVLPLWMLAQGATSADVAAAVAVPVVGMLAAGGFCARLIQHYRRERVCTLAATLLAMCLLMTHYVPWLMAQTGGTWVVMTVLRLLTGAAFGLAQTVLMCVLLIDSCPSTQRTEANHVSAWFGRLGMVLGPVTAITINDCADFEWMLVTMGVMCIGSVLLVRSTELKFKAPDESRRRWSADRFVLPQGLLLAVNLALSAAVVGIVLAVEHTALFYALFGAGLLVAMLAGRWVFANAELKSEIVTGLLLMAAALLMLRTYNAVAVTHIAPVLFGMGTGISSSRYQLFFIKLRRHCQRGTSQNTYLLAWETGLAAGLLVGYMVFPDTLLLLYIALWLCAAALLMYIAHTHTWYMSHKSR